MRKQLLSLLFIFLSIPIIYAQDLSENEQQIEKKAFTEIDKKNYAEALPLFSQLLSLHPKNLAYNFNYAICLIETNENPTDALKFLKYVARDSDDPLVYYYLGKAYHLNYQFNKALLNYNYFKSHASKRDLKEYDVTQLIRMAQNGKELINYVTELHILQNKKIKDENFYYSYDLDGLGGKLIITPPDFKTKIDKKKKYRGITFMRGDTLAFYASYGNDKRGSLDLYVRHRDENYQWTEAQSLGPIINSPYDDAFPYLAPNGHTLYFSSKGHNSMGGYDIFKIEYDVANNKAVDMDVVNMDFPINSPYDDLLYVTDKADKFAFFSSKRETGKNKIAVYKILVEKNPKRRKTNGLDDILKQAKMEPNVKPKKEENIIASSENPTKKQTQQPTAKNQVSFKPINTNNASKALLVKTVDEDIAVLNADLKKSAKAAVVFYKSSNEALEKSKKQDQIIAALKEKIKTADASKKPILQRQLLREQDDAFLYRSSAINQYKIYEQLVESQKLKKKDLAILTNFKSKLNHLSSDAEIKQKLKELQALRNKIQANRNKYPSEEEELAKTKEDIAKNKAKLQEINKKLTQNETALNELIKKTKILNQEIDDAQKENDSYVLEKRQKQLAKLKDEYSKLLNQQKQLLAQETYYEHQQKLNNNEMALLESLPEKTKDITVTNLVEPVSSSETQSFSQIIKNEEADADMELNTYTAEVIKTKSKSLPATEQLFPEEKLAQATPQTPTAQTSTTTASSTQQSQTTTVPVANNTTSSTQKNTISSEEINTLSAQIEDTKQQLANTKNKTKQNELKAEIANLKTIQNVLTAEQAIQNDPVIVSMNQQIAEKKALLKTATPEKQQQIQKDINNLKQIQSKLEADAMAKQLGDQNIDKTMLSGTLDKTIANTERNLQKTSDESKKQVLLSRIQQLKKVQQLLSSSTEAPETQLAENTNNTTDILTKDLDIKPTDNTIRKYEKTMLKKALLDNRIENNTKRLAQLKKINATTSNPIPELQQQITHLKTQIEQDKEEVKKLSTQLTSYKQQASSETNKTTISDNNILSVLADYTPKNDIKPIDDVNAAKRVSELSTKATKNKLQAKSIDYQLSDLKEQYKADENPEIKAKITKLTKERNKKRAAYISQENLSNILTFNALSDKLLNIESNHPEWKSRKASSLIAEGDYYANLAQHIQKNIKNIEDRSIKEQEEEKALALQKIAIAKKTQALDIYTDVSHGKVNKNDEDDYYNLPEIVLSSDDEEALDNADDLNYLTQTLRDEIASLESKVEDLKDEREKTLDQKKQKKLDKKIQKLQQIIDDKRIEEQGYHIMAGKTEDAINSKYIDTLLQKHEKDPVVELCLRQANLYKDAILKTNDEINKESDSQKKQKLYNKLESEYDELITEQRAIINRLLKRQPQPFLAARALSRINPLSELNRRLSMGKLPEFDKNELYQQLHLTDNERKDLDYATKLETQFIADKNKAWEVEQKIISVKDKLKTATNPREKEKLQAELDKLTKKKMTILTTVYDNYEPVNFTRHEILRRQIRKFRTNLDADAKLKIKQLVIRSQQKFKRATNLRDASFMAEDDDEIYNDLQKTVELEQSSINDLEKALAIATNLIKENKQPVLAENKPVNTENAILKNTGTVKPVETPLFNKDNITYTCPETLEKGKMKDLIININNTSNYKSLLIAQLSLPKAIVVPSISTQAKKTKEQGIVKISWDKMPMADVAKISLMPISNYSGTLNLKFTYIGTDNQMKEFSFDLPVETTGFQLATNTPQPNRNLTAQTTTVSPTTNNIAQPTETSTTTTSSNTQNKSEEASDNETNTSNPPPVQNTVETASTSNPKPQTTTTSSTQTNTQQEASQTASSNISTSENKTTTTSSAKTKNAQPTSPSYTSTTNSSSVGSKIFSNLSVPAYNDANPIPINSEWPAGLVFKIQIGAFAKPVSNTAFGGLNPLSAELRTNSKWYRYFVGNFKSYEGALAALPLVKNIGYRDAFIVAYLDGKRIPLYKGRIKTKQIDNYNAIAQQEISEITGTASAPVASTSQPTAQTSESTNNIGNVQSIKEYKNLLYTVQVGVFKSTPKTTYFRGLSPIYQEQTPYGFVRYFTGIFNDYQQALAERDRIIALGISDAFVAIYNNGKRISLSEAQKLEQAGTQKTTQSKPVSYPEAPPAPPSNTIDKASLWFTVQVGAYKEQVPLDVTQNLIKISRNNAIKQITDERGYTLFLVGNFKSYAKAKSFAAILKNDGVLDAFVAAFSKDKKVSLEQAKALLP